MEENVTADVRDPQVDHQHVVAAVPQEGGRLLDGLRRFGRVAGSIERDSERAADRRLIVYD